MDRGCLYACDRKSVAIALVVAMAHSGQLTRSAASGNLLMSLRISATITVAVVKSTPGMVHGRWIKSPHRIRP
jgi:hypothetical protein